MATTAESIVTTLPIQTLEALPSAMPDYGSITDPKDEPLTQWNGIPVMPAATAGVESSGMYSFKADVTVTEVVDYYKAELTSLGWTELFALPDTGSGALLSYEMGDHIVTITITSGTESGTLVYLTYQ